MYSELFLLSKELRAVSHILRYSDYIYSVTGDVDFPTALISVVSDYLYARSEHCCKVLESVENHDEE